MTYIYRYQSKICGTPSLPTDCLAPQARMQSGEYRIFSCKSKYTELIFTTFSIHMYNFEALMCLLQDFRWQLH